MNKSWLRVGEYVPLVMNPKQLWPALSREAFHLTSEFQNDEMSIIRLSLLVLFMLVNQDFSFMCSSRTEQTV